MKKYKLGLVALMAVFALLGMASYADAAALTWSADQTVDFSDPDVSVTIESGSTATSLIVGTGSLQVVVPSGSTFTVTSTARDFVFSGDTTSIVSSVCTDTTATGSIQGGGADETITITLTANTCSSGNGGGSGGGGGGGSKKTTPATPATPAAPGCLAGYLFSPITGAPCGTTAGGSSTTPASPASPSAGGGYAFGTGVVKMGTKGEACRAWQTFFNEKAGANLVVDGWCGKLTMAFAKGWQSAHGLVADGLLGPASRAKANTQ